MFRYFLGRGPFGPKKTIAVLIILGIFNYFYNECKWLAVGSEVVCPAGSLRVEPAFLLKGQIIRFRIVINCGLFNLLHIANNSIGLLNNFTGY